MPSVASAIPPPRYHPPRPRVQLEGEDEAQALKGTVSSQEYRPPQDQCNVCANLSVHVLILRGTGLGPGFITRVPLLVFGGHGFKPTL